MWSKVKFNVRAVVQLLVSVGSLDRLHADDCSCTCVSCNCGPFSSTFTTVLVHLVLWGGVSEFRQSGDE